jgi:hypothetical protein
MDDFIQLQALGHGVGDEEHGDFAFEGVDGAGNGQAQLLPAREACAALADGGW